MHLSLTHPDSRRLTDYSSKIEMIPREYIGIAVQRSATHGAPAQCTGTVFDFFRQNL
jgi:hypothetical protein